MALVLLALACALLVVAGLTHLATDSSSEPDGRAQAALPRGVLFRDTFNGPNGLVTNHYAAWSGDPAAVRSPNWTVESGSLFRRHDRGWTGVPTVASPNRDSSMGSGSAIFRAWTTRTDFGNVVVRMRLRTLRYVRGTRRWPRKSWDGVKIWLRRQGALRGRVALYTAEVNRRQGNVLIQKKCRRSRRYRILGILGNRPARFGRWETVGGSVRTRPDGSVALTLIRNGVVVLRAIDKGKGCRPITGTGRVGVRGDNTEFYFDNFTVKELGPRGTRSPPASGQG